MMSGEAATQRIREAKENQSPSLSLAHMELRSLPEEITELTDLRILNLQSNDLRRFPAQLWRLRKLRSLHLGFNSIAELPQDICRFTSLEQLFLGYNPIRELPLGLARLENLRTLHLNNNQVSRIPLEIARLPRLQELVVTMNQIQSPPIHIANQGIKKIREWFGLPPQASQSSTRSPLPEFPEAGSPKESLVTQAGSRESHQTPVSACLDSPRPSLDQLALKHGTDKGSRNGSRPGLDYCNQYYEPMLAPFRDRPIKLLEIGIKQGDSLRMWQEYFSEALIYGIDVNPQAMISNQERILTFCGEQQDTRFLERIVRDDGPFDFVIDDGGHWAEHQLVSLRFFAPHVRRIYFIEDLWNGHIHGGDAFIEALSSDLSKIAYGESSMWRSVHLHPHFVALEKKGARDS